MRLMEKYELAVLSEDEPIAPIIPLGKEAFEPCPGCGMDVMPGSGLCPTCRESMGDLFGED